MPAGREAPRLGLGTAALGNPYGLLRNAALSSPETAEQESFAILDEALACGVTLLDTASLYGSSERIVGRYFEARPGQEAFIVTKFAPPHWRAQLRESRRLLGQRLGALLWHNFDPSSAGAQELLRDLEESREELDGILLGCSTYGARAAGAALDAGIFDVLEVEYSLLNPSVLRAVSRSVGPTVLLLRSVLHKGFLTDAALATWRPVHPDPATDGRLRSLGERLHALARERGKSVEELALRWAASTTRRETILFGANALGQAARNAAWLRLPPLEPGLIQELQTLAAGLEPADLDLRSWLR